MFSLFDNVIVKSNVGEETRGVVIEIAPYSFWVSHGDKITPFCWEPRQQKYHLKEHGVPSEFAARVKIL